MDKTTDPVTVMTIAVLLLLTVSAFRPDSAGAIENDAPRPGLVESLLPEQKAEAALAEFRSLGSRNRTSAACRGAAQASALLDRPEDALRYYQEALELAGGSEMERRASLFGIARMHLWLENYAGAERIYRQLLAQDLTKEDHAVASAGLIRSLSFQDRPMFAYRSAPPGPALSSGERMELARAALWAGWPDKAAALLDQDIPVQPETRMAKELEALRGEVSAETGNPVELHAAFAGDSDGMRIRKSELAAAKRIFTTGELGVVFQHQGFEQHERQLSMNSLQVRGSSRLGDAFRLMLQAGPAAYGEWRTGLWAGSLTYRPGDQLGFEAFVGREAVETFAALERRAWVDTIGVTASYAPVSGILLSGSAYRQSFRDDNNRTGGNARIATPVSERHGLNIQFRARYFEDSRTDTVGYFNPKRFHQEQLLFELNRRISHDWRLSALAGPGVQNTTPGDGSSTTLLAELSLRGRIINGVSLGADYGYSNSALASSSGYRRQYSGLTLSCQW